MRRLAQGARDRVLRHYSMSSAESIFWRAFDERFPELIPKTSKADYELLAGGELVGMIG